VDVPQPGGERFAVIASSIPAPPTPTPSPTLTPTVTPTPSPTPLPTVTPTPTLTPTPTPVAPPSGGLGFAVMLLVAAVAAVVIYAFVLSGRRKMTGGGPTQPAPDRLVVLRGPGQGHVVALTGAQFTIGRSTSNMLRLSAPDVSRQHAVLYSSQGRWFLQDQNSTTGTYLNGRRVQASILSNGDVIRIGDSEIQFQQG
jgi:hypothetical protein